MVDDDVREHAARTVAADAELLIGLSERLHAHPETAWEEHRSARWVAETLAGAGFAVTPAYLGLETAFLATYGSGPFRLGLCAEYDALPGLGHACGTTSSRPSRSARRWRSRRSPTPRVSRSRSTARRPKRAAAARSSCWIAERSPGSTSP